MLIICFFMSSIEVLGYELHDKYYEAIDNIKNGNIEIALTISDELITSKDHSDWGYRIKILTHKETNTLSELKQYILSNHKKSNKDGAILYALGYISYLNNDIVTASKYLDDCIEVGFDGYLVKVLQSDIERDKGNYIKSFMHIDDAINIYDDYDFAKDGLAISRIMWIISDYLFSLHKKNDNVSISNINDIILNTHSVGNMPLLKIDGYECDNVFSEKKVITLILRFENNYGCIFFIDATSSDLSVIDGLDIEINAERNSFEIINQYNNILLIKSREITGSHHGKNTIYALTKKGASYICEKEGQTLDPITFDDINNDGWPEMIIDHSDHYVKSYASGYKNFNYYIYNFDRDNNRYEFIPYVIELNNVRNELYNLNALSIYYSANGYWKDAYNTIVNASKLYHGGCKDFEWNYLIIEYHYNKFFKQLKNNPSFSNKLLFGDFVGLTEFKFNNYNNDKFNSTIPAVKLLNSATSNKNSTEALMWLISNIYKKGYSANNLLHDNFWINIYNKGNTGELIIPEINAREIMLFSYHANRILPNNVLKKISQLSPILIESNVFNKNKILNELDVFDYKSKRNIIDYAHKSIFDYVSMYSENKNILENKYAAVISRLTNLLRSNNILSAKKLLNKIPKHWHYNEDIKDFLIFATYMVDYHYGRYEKIVSFLNKRDDIFTIPLLNLYEAYEHLEIYEKPESIYNVILKKFSNFDNNINAYISSGNDPYALILSFYGLGRICFAKKEYLKAKKYFSKSINLINSIQFIPYHNISTKNILLWLAKTHLSLNNLTLAKAYNSFALYSSIQTTQPKGGWIQSTFMYDYNILANIYLNEYYIAKKSSNDKMALACLSAALSLVDDIYNSLDNINDRIGLTEVAQIIYKEAIFYQLDKGLINESFILSNKIKSKSLMQQIFENNSKNNKRIFSGIDYNTKNVFNKLSHKKIYIKYVLYKNELLIFVVKKGRIIKYHKSHINYDQLKEDIEVVLEDILGVDNQNNDVKYNSYKKLNNLYNILIKPIESKLNKNEEIVIIPDGILYNLPFSALRDDDDTFLIEKHTLSFLNSINDINLIQTNDGAKISNNILVIHSPITTKYNTLNYAPKEAEYIDKYAKSKSLQILSKHDATIDNFIAYSKSKDIIHFATHSFIDSSNPEMSKIVLSSNQNNISYLSIKDFIDGKISFINNPLIVLSSCNSASGKIYQEGILGFAYGMFLSGATIRQAGPLLAGPAHLRAHRHHGHQAHQDLRRPARQEDADGGLLDRLLQHARGQRGQPARHGRLHGPQAGNPGRLPVGRQRHHRAEMARGGPLLAQGDRSGPLRGPHPAQ